MKQKVLKTLAVMALLLALVNGPAHAHPIEYHMQPLDTETVERVISSLENIAGELGGSAPPEKAGLADSSVGMSALLWSIQESLMAAEESTTLDSPGLNRALSSAGYPDSPYVVEEWQAEAEQVLETYEVLKRGLNLEQVYAGYAALERDRGSLDEETAIERESMLLRNHQLVRTTGKDRELLKQYLDRLDALVSRLGLSDLQ